MKKTDKKIDNALRSALTQVCEVAQDSIEGFVWLTHLVDYQAFPSSLKIACIFETDEQLANANQIKQTDQLSLLIDDKLTTMGIKLRNRAQQVVFDTEEACALSHKGKWNERLSRRHVH